MRAPSLPHRPSRLVRSPVVILSLLFSLLALLAFPFAHVSEIPPKLHGNRGWRGDAVFVPSGDPDNERTLRAVQIVNEGRARLLVIAGAGYGGDSSQFLAAAAIEAGLSKDALVLEKHSTNTWQNFDLARPLIAANHIRRMLIVTNRMHARRALLLARASLPDVEVSVEAVDRLPMPMAIRTRELEKTLHESLLGHLSPLALFLPLLIMLSPLLDAERSRRAGRREQVTVPFVEIH